MGTISATGHWHLFGLKCRTSKDLLKTQRRQRRHARQDNSRMNKREIFFDVLTKCSSREQAALLIPAFEHADDDERTPLAETLARTGRPEAVQTLIRRWPQIEPKRRRTIARLPNDPHAAIESLLLDADAQLLRQTIDFIRDRGDARLTPLLLPLLETGETDRNGSDPEAAAHHAAGALLLVTVDQLGRCVGRAIDPASFAALDHALARALDSYRSHRCDDVLLAVAIAAGRPGPKLRTILDQSDHPGTVALRRVPQHIEEELVRANLIRWLGVPIMQRPALRRLDSIRTAGQWNDVLATGHLLLSPERRRAMRRYPARRRMLPTVADAVQLDGRAQSNLIDWVRSCGLTTPQRISYLRDLIALPSPLSRMKAVRLLGKLAGAGVSEASEAMRSFTRDGNELVARLAQRTLRHNRAADNPPGNARDADDTALWQRWDVLSPQQRFAAAARLAARDPAAAALVLRTVIATNDRRRTLDGLALIERLGFAKWMRHELFAALKSDDAHIVALAVRVLGRTASARGDEQTAQQLRKMLDHENARVRANAVEALAGNTPEIASLTSVDDNRLRANAVRTMLLDRATSEAASASWREMARDARPLHRISAIWVAARTPRRTMLDDLQRLRSEADEPLPEVRTRAAAALCWVERYGRETNNTS